MISERYPNILSTAEREQYTQALRILTRNAIGPKQDSHWTGPWNSPHNWTRYG